MAVEKWFTICFECEVNLTVHWSSENQQQQQTFSALKVASINITWHAGAETVCTVEYVIESHVIGHIKAPNPQLAKDK